MTVENLNQRQELNIEALRDRLPDFAKDIRLNLSNVMKEDPQSGLTLNQVYGVALASAYASRNADIIAAVENETAGTLSTEEINAARAAATIMAMNNIYYRFLYMSKDAELAKMPAGLRMNVIGNPGIAKLDFELYSLAVSAVNGCASCVESHAKAVENGGITKLGLQHTVKIAAVLNAAAQALSV